MKGFSSNRIALKIDVIRPESVRFAGASLPYSARKFYRLGAVKGLSYLFTLRTAFVNVQLLSQMLSFHSTDCVCQCTTVGESYEATEPEPPTATSPPETGGAPAIAGRLDRFQRYTTSP